MQVPELSDKSAPLWWCHVPLIFLPTPMKVSIDDDLRDSREVSFQAALLYTSSKGERRIRVHTLCLPTTSSVADVMNGGDQEAIVGMLTKFGE